MRLLTVAGLDRRSAYLFMTERLFMMKRLTWSPERPNRPGSLNLSAQLRLLFQALPAMRLAAQGR